MKYPIAHNLDGVYFRVLRNNKWKDVCFSDLTNIEREEIINDKSEAWLKSLCKILANTLYNIGEQFNIYQQDSDYKNEN